MVVELDRFQQSLALTFGSNGLPLSEEDVTLLIDSYKTSRSGQTYVLWKRFVEDVASIFTTRGLEKTPLATPTPLVAQLPRPRGVLSAERIKRPRGSVRVRLRAIAGIPRPRVAARRT